MGGHTILAPHPDDELIGCFRLILTNQVSTVVYPDSTPHDRLEEAAKMCDYFGIEQHVVAWSSLPASVSKHMIVLVPSPADGHPDHVATYWACFRHIKRLGVYSVYMNDWFVRELAQVEQESKHEYLDRFYPSQRSLWERDWKYFLFEGVAWLD